METALIEAVDEGCQNLRKKHSSERKYVKFHPSSFGDCARKTYYNHTGVKGIPHESKTLRIFDTGHKIHELMVEYLVESQAFNVINDEFTVYDALFEGHVDCFGVIDGEQVIVDFKTIGNDSFESISLYGRAISKLYVWQAHIYMHLLKVKKFKLLFFNKNDQRLFEKTIKWQDGLIDEIYRKAAKVLSCIQRKEVPDREFKKSNFKCKTCEFREVCWK